jgi:hypothetical protein
MFGRCSLVAQALPADKWINFFQSLSISPMAAKPSKRSRIVLVLCVMLGLLGLLMFRRSTGPKAVIAEVLKRNGYPPETIKQWTAVSQFETADFTSKVLKDSNNLFNIIVPGSNRLKYGEGQTIYASQAESVQGLVDHVMRPFKYPAVYDSPEALVEFMKSKNYFGSDLQSYKIGVRQYYDRL